MKLLEKEGVRKENRNKEKVKIDDYVNVIQ